MTNPVDFSIRGSVALITIDRPKANAIDLVTSLALGDAFARLRDTPQLRAGILTGAGNRIFSAGWDLKAAAHEGESESADFGPGGFAGIEILLDSNKPIIAAVNGWAIGGGFELALACDMIVAASHAQFRLPETGLGVVADAGGVQRLHRRIPRNIAVELLVTGRIMDAHEAARWGLVNQMVDENELLEAALALAGRVAEGAPLAVEAIKEIIRGTEAMAEKEAVQAVRTNHFPTYAAMLRSEDHDEGPRAFAEKRKPVWKRR